MYVRRLVWRMSVQQLVKRSAHLDNIRRLQLGREEGERRRDKEEGREEEEGREKGEIGERR